MNKWYKRGLIMVIIGFIGISYNILVFISAILLGLGLLFIMYSYIC